MSIFSQYRPTYKEIERFSIEEARANRLAAMLDRERRFAEIPNFTDRLAEQNRKAALSRLLNKTEVTEPKAYQGAMTGRPKATLNVAAALSLFKEQDFTDPKARAAYRNLRAQQENQKRAQAAKSRYREKVPDLGIDNRQYNPTGKDYARTIYGNIARLSGWTNVTGLGQHFQRSFEHAHHVIPCIERGIRKEVMFAKKYAGKGYRVPHHRSWKSGVPC